jgi:hypothetical protein
LSPTASAVPPTPTPAPTPTLNFTEIRDCPSSGNPGLPDEPPAFEDYLSEICSFLVAGGSVSTLEARLKNWGTYISDTKSQQSSGSVWEIDDLAGNGSEDIVVIAYEPTAVYDPTGHLYVIDCVLESCRVLYEFPFILFPSRKEPEILQSGDINADGALDLTYIQFTGSDTRGIPYHTITSLEWNESQQQLKDLTDGGIKIGGCLREITDTDGDGVNEIVAAIVARDREHGPPPHRMDTAIYAWDGTQYVLSQTIPGPPLYRYQALEDAWAAVEGGDFDSALQLYQQAIQDDDLLQLWVELPEGEQPEREQPKQRPYIAAYAYYRMMLVHVLKGDIGTARATQERLVGEYRIEGNDDQWDESKLGYGFAQMAHIFWQAFETDQNVSTGCDAVVTYATENPQLIEWLVRFGGGLDATVEEPLDLCPF